MNACILSDPDGKAVVVMRNLNWGLDASQFSPQVSFAGGPKQKTK